MAITIQSSRDNSDDKTVSFTIAYGGKDYKWHGDIPKDADAQDYLDAKSDTLKTEILRKQYNKAVVPQLEGKTPLESFEAWVSAGCKNTVVTTPAVEASDAVTGERQKTKTVEVEEEVSNTEIVKEDGKYVEKTTTETVTKQVVSGVTEEVDLFDEDGNKIGKHTIPVMESYESSPAVEAVDEVTEDVVIPKKTWVDSH
tara:strand:- start:161 stop:757 length:597 start_codon:yes stop_codon:yes gene_type:complete